MSRADKNARAVQARKERFAAGDFAPKQKPVLRDGPFYHEPPSYRTSRYYAAHPEIGMIAALKEGMPGPRCFFTGLPSHLGNAGESRHPRENPWLATRDHLVPARRAARDTMGALGILPPELSRYPVGTVWTSAVANSALGVVPLGVRLTVRAWLAASNYDRDDVSVASGENVRWLLFALLLHFRIPQGERYFWSRDFDGRWWNPKFQEPLMARCYAVEREFLALDIARRDLFVRTYRFHY